MVYKKLFMLVLLAQFFVIGVIAAETKTAAGESSSERLAATESLETAQISAPVFTLGIDLLEALSYSGSYCENTGGSCTSSDQCGFLGWCVNGKCRCECDYGAYCNSSSTCGFAGFCMNHHCNCY